MTHPTAYSTGHRPVSLLDPADQSILRVLEHDWRRLCGLDVAPAHGRFLPADLDAALPHAFILQRVAPGVARMRVAGQKLHDMMRMDPRGMPFAAFFADDSRDLAIEMLEQAFTTPAVIGMSLSASRGLGRKPVRAEALLLPMRDAEGALTRMMGAIVTTGPLPNRPLRFDIAKGQPLRCDKLQPGLVERRARRGQVPLSSVPAPNQLPAVLRTPETTSTPARPQSPRPGLRLVVDNTV